MIDYCWRTGQSKHRISVKITYWPISPALAASSAASVRRSINHFDAKKSAPAHTDRHDSSRGSSTKISRLLAKCQSFDYPPISGQLSFRGTFLLAGLTAALHVRQVPFRGCQTVHPVPVAETDLLRSVPDAVLRLRHYLAHTSGERGTLDPFGRRRVTRRIRIIHDYSMAPSVNNTHIKLFLGNKRDLA